MKINRKEVQLVAFGQLNAGEVFEFDGTPYMKVKTPRVPPSGCWPAVALDDGDMCHFRDDTLVHHLPDAFLNLGEA